MIVSLFGASHVGAQTVVLPADGAANRRIEQRTIYGSEGDRRVNKRVANRLQTRLRTRIDQNYDPAGDALRPFEAPPTDGTRAGPR